MRWKRVSPRGCARQGLACGAERDVGCDDREDKPGGKKPPPVKFGSKVERYYPHLEQSHQLQQKKKVTWQVLEETGKNTHTINTLRSNMWIASKQMQSFLSTHA